MKKIKMIGMLALAFTLVFGAVSCKNETEEGPWGDSLADVLKEEKNLSLAGKWKAVEGDFAVDMDIDVSDEMIEFLKLMMFDGKNPDKMTDKEKIEAAVAEIDAWSVEKEISKEDGKLEPQYLVEYEKYIKDTYKKGPVEYSGNKKYADINIMINGDRDELRIEYMSEIQGKFPKASEESSMPAVLSEKKFSATEECYAIWKLQK